MKNIELKSVDLTTLKNLCEIIQIRFDNSNNIIQEMGGPDDFYIRVDTSKNSAIPFNENKDLSTMEQFTNANYAGIYGSYIEAQSFEGCFDIYPIDEKQNWNLNFHGGFLENESGDISEENKSKIIQYLGPIEVYNLANEVLETCRYI